MGKSLFYWQPVTLLSLDIDTIMFLLSISGYSPPADTPRGRGQIFAGLCIFCLQDLYHSLKERFLTTFIYYLFATREFLILFFNNSRKDSFCTNSGVRGGCDKQKFDVAVMTRARDLLTTYFADWTTIFYWILQDLNIVCSYKKARILKAYQVIR